MVIYVYKLGAKYTAGINRENYMFHDDVTVGQFCSLYIDCTEKVRIWSVDQHKVLFEGTYRDAEICEYANEVISSFGIEDGMNCLNI